MRAIGVSVLLALVAGLAAPLHAADAAKPNFLVILCDDLGYGDLACYGHPTIRTPNLDALAAQGLRLTDCYASAPVCSASRSGLLTGRTPTRVGVYDWIPNGHAMHLRSSEVTIATLLRRAGYATCHVGKWHCNGKFNSPMQPQPGDHGFDHWLSTQNNAEPSHRNPTNFVRNGEPAGPQLGYSCDIVVHEALDWLGTQRDPAKPFFQFVCFHEPHEPIASPPDLVAQYAAGRVATQAEYFANVTNMDRAVGRLLAGLDELKLADDTLVFFTSDNGPETLNRYGGAERSHGSPGKLRGMKLHVYEGGIRVPGIVRFPNRIKAGQMSGEPVSNVDLLPTFCTLAGAAIPTDRTLDGANFAGIFSGQPVQRTTPLYWHYYRAIGRAKAALRDGDWMIIGCWKDAFPKPGSVQFPADYATIQETPLVDFELYNLRADVSQQHDLAQTEPQRLKAMSEQLVAKYREVQQAAPRFD